MAAKTPFPDGVAERRAAIFNRLRTRTNLFRAFQAPALPPALFNTPRRHP